MQEACTSDVQKYCGGVEAEEGQATVISLSHTLLHDALHSQPPSGAAVLSCVETLARDGAPIRDISLVAGCATPDLERTSKICALRRLTSSVPPERRSLAPGVRTKKRPRWHDLPDSPCN
ncbi:hypothetical protein Vretimale_12732 [Volvox reticuliferus]|uniref:Uncharacterized protein n=1 Tax=Volvox reticuliferus TaxID=1737510 RepID=A0A8J4LTC0_9CHLO|nr:hypothetical protein Vretimale_12732 [Volvox reticuliferus]